MRKLKTGTILALVLCSFSLVSLCSAQKAWAGQALEMQIAHVNAPSHPAHQALLKFKELVEQRTNGGMEITIFDSSVLGGELEEIDQVITGSLDSAMIMGISNWQGRIPQTAVEELPFMYPDEIAARKAFDGAYGDKIKELIEPTGVKILCYWESGFRHFTNNVRPIFKPEDMQGIKFRTAQSAIRIKMFEVLGASATSMPFPEVYSGLQQGVIEGQENPLSIITANAFYEVQKYLTLSGHFYSTAPFIVNPTYFNNLPAEYQKIITDTALECRDIMREMNSKATGEMLETLKQNGMEINQIDTESFAERMEPVWKMFSDEFGNELIDLARKSSGQE